MTKEQLIQAVSQLSTEDLFILRDFLKAMHTTETKNPRRNREKGGPV